MSLEGFELLASIQGKHPDSYANVIRSSADDVRLLVSMPDGREAVIRLGVSQIWGLCSELLKAIGVGARAAVMQTAGELPVTRRLAALERVCAWARDGTINDTELVERARVIVEADAYGAAVCQTSGTGDGSDLDPVDVICGETLTCQLEPGHPAAHQCPSDDLSVVHVWPRPKKGSR